MTGSIRWNLWAGCTGLALIFLTSVSSNPVMLSLIRSLYGFAVLFLVFFPIRYAIGSVVGGTVANTPAEDEDAMKGASVDLITPSDDPELDKLLYGNRQEQDAGGAGPSPDTDEFVPLAPTRLVRTESTLDPEEIAKAIRGTMNNDERG